ncbi:MAG: MBL fold metallo-hydrolase [Rikenellaceae bacterium]
MSKFTASIASQEGFRIDTITAKSGEQIDFIFFGHASFAISTSRYIIYVDPVMAYAPYGSLPKADLIVVTHSHYDHLDAEAIDAVKSVDMPIVCDKTSADILAREVLMMSHGSEVEPIEGVKIEGVAAYNMTPDRTQFHPHSREDCGYIFTIEGTKIYVAGDSENTPEMKSVKGVDIAFLPVNQPYTMTVDQAIDAVKAIRPTIFYPYHYGGVDEVTNVDALAQGLTDICEVRLRGME